MSIGRSVGVRRPGAGKTRLAGRFTGMRKHSCRMVDRSASRFVPTRPVGGQLSATVADRVRGDKGSDMCAKARPTGDDLPGKAISIHALLAEDGVSPNVQPGFNARQIIQAADVILGMDVMTRGTF